MIMVRGTSNVHPLSSQRFGFTFGGSQNFDELTFADACRRLNLSIWCMGLSAIGGGYWGRLSGEALEWTHLISPVQATYSTRLT